MTQTRRSRPAVNWTASGTTSTSSDVTPGSLAAAGLRRRRHASWRCPPLASGHRDPWPRSHPASQRGLAEAVAHILAAGLIPIFTIEEGRQAWADAGELEREALTVAAGAMV